MLGPEQRPRPFTFPQGLHARPRATASDQHLRAQAWCPPQPRACRLPRGCTVTILPQSPSARSRPAHGNFPWRCRQPTSPTQPASTRDEVGMVGARQCLLLLNLNLTVLGGQHPAAAKSGSAEHTPGHACAGGSGRWCPRRQRRTSAASTMLFPPACLSNGQLVPGHSVSRSLNGDETSSRGSGARAMACRGGCLKSPNPEDLP